MYVTDRYIYILP